ncbi:MAG TPA: hypothetical protein VFS21_30680 [Roseiflexaceae bacterium]|nr:hypothetical protein [Roseiflexaceae bacterium]
MSDVIDRNRLVRELVVGQHPLLLLVLAHWTQNNGRTCMEQLAVLSDAQLDELVERGIIAAPVAEAPLPVEPLPAAPSPFPGLDAAMAEARTLSTPWQRSVQPGDAIVVGDPEGDLLVYARVEADPDCLPDCVYSERWCSVGCPEGEGGDNHRSMILMRLRGDELARAEAEGWPETLDELFCLIWPLRGAAAA